MVGEGNTENWDLGYSWQHFNLNTRFSVIGKNQMKLQKELMATYQQVAGPYL